MHLNKFDQFREIKRIFYLFIGNDKQFLFLSIIYGIAVSLLTLAVPVSVQLLINTVAHTASLEAVIILSSLLFFVLLCSALLTALQHYAMELFERRIYVRLTGEITLRNVYSDYQYSQIQNKCDLTNRYFDIMNIQKIVPYLVIGLFTLLLQAIVGILLVSLYHAWLLAFNVVFVLLVWAIWYIWGYDATFSSIELSDAKYKTGRHIEDVAREYSFYASEKNGNYAIQKSNKLINNYIDYRKKHFQHSYSQQIALLILYAFASSGLLGVGGVLVVNNELTLGQLVAAELILSAVFYGVSRLGEGFSYVYQLGASLEEIYRIYQMPLEKPGGYHTLEKRPCDLKYDKTVFIDENQKEVTLSFTLKGGSKIAAHCSHHKTQEIILQSIACHLEPAKGRIMLGKLDFRDIDTRYLRDRVIVLDNPNMIECTIREYLHIVNSKLTSSDIHNILEFVELNHIIESLDKGMDTQLSHSGMPLSPTQTLRLKLGAALLEKPHILVLNEFFDTISYVRFQRIFRRIHDIRDMSLLYFSNRTDIDVFDQNIYFDHNGDVNG